MRLGARDRVSEAERIALARVEDVRELGDRADLLQLVELPLRLEEVLELGRPVEVVLDRPLPAAGHHQDVGDAGPHRLLHHELDRRRVDTGSISLGVALVAGRKRVPSPATGITAFWTFTGATVLAVAEKMSAVRTGPRVDCTAGMPTYEYTCRDCGHTFDIVQSMWDESLTMCPECGGSLRKVFAPPAISFKGSGFYATDHGKKSKSASESGRIQVRRREEVRARRSRKARSDGQRSDGKKSGERRARRDSGSKERSGGSSSEGRPRPRRRSRRRRDRRARRDRGDRRLGLLRLPRGHADGRGGDAVRCALARRSRSARWATGRSRSSRATARIIGSRRTWSPTGRTCGR